jgi:uncharacterized membrane protein YidH (DUF202 family)
MAASVSGRLALGRPTSAGKDGRRQGDMTNFTEPLSPSSKAGRTKRQTRLDIIAAVLIAAVGLGLAWYARGYFVHREAGPCPGGYCGLFESIGYLILITAVLVLVLAAGVAAHRRKARLIGLVVCGIAGGWLLIEVLRSLAAAEDATRIEPDPLFAITVGIAGFAVALAAAAVLLYFSVTAERGPTDA